ncbi:hypothetical protein KA005_65485 [bacterium]|nr:hypothetical protein [bacterium]
MFKNKLICGDNLEILSTMESESVDLIYIDPPFFSNRNYEIVWKDEAEIRSFEDRWAGGIHVYIDWMRQRVIELHRVLKKAGSFYLHCDWHAGHYLKVMCDTVFGYKNFQNEIVWCYRTGGATKIRFSRKHDNILFYTKSNIYTFNCKKERVYYEKPFFVSKKDNKGRYYADVLPVDWWNMPAVINTSKERLGYQTQKPEALLDRIISASSKKNEIVLDAFCGCGTSLASAEKLGRHWIGIDISPSAIALIKKIRLRKMGVSEKDIDIIGMPETTNHLKEFKPYEFQYWVINEMAGKVSDKKSGDMGIDGYSFLEHCPIQVKRSEHVGRNVIDNFETALRRYYSMRKDVMKGYIVAFSYTPGAKEEVARAKKDNFDIELLTVQDILDKKLKVRYKGNPD